MYLENFDELKMKLIEGNARYVSGVSNLAFNSKKAAELTLLGQKPKIVILTCSDSRVIPEAIFDMPIGELFVIRCAGNIVGDMELASLEYAIAHLKAELVVVLAHTHCGAIHSTIHDKPHGYIKNITKRIKENILAETNEFNACVLNATREKERIKKLLKNYEFDVASAIYDIERGEVTFLD